MPRAQGFGLVVDTWSIAKVREIIAMLEGDGWQRVRTRGSRRQFKHPIKPGAVSGKLGLNMPRGTLNSVLKQARLK